MTPVKRGEIYYANLCPVVGSEQGGIRPVLIIQNDIGNKFSPTTIIAAITSQVPKHQFPTQVPIKPACLPKSSIVKLEQIRTIDKSRLKAYIGALSEQDMEADDKAIEISLGLEYLEVLRK